jgi:putative tryptophan/tyrosine transport system substrate-binding protein
LAAERVREKVDLIATAGGTPAALAAKSATSTIPIVFALVSDPVGIGLVESLARPGGNVTGFGNMTTELMPKRLELLSELVPQARVIALLVNPTNAYTEPMIRVVQEAAHAKGLQLPILKASNASEIDRAFGSLAKLRADGLVIGAEPFLSGSRREQLVALASRYAIPAIYEARATVTAGGLISYGVDLTDLSRQAGIYAGRILKGVKPSDLPVQEPTKFELVVNLGTAKALSLTVPPSILARADEVIE